MFLAECTGEHYLQVYSIFSGYLSILFNFLLRMGELSSIPPARSGGGQGELESVSKWVCQNKFGHSDRIYFAAARSGGAEFPPGKCRSAGIPPSPPGRSIKTIRW